MKFPRLDDLHAKIVEHLNQVPDKPKHLNYEVNYSWVVSGLDIRDDFDSGVYSRTDWRFSDVGVELICFVELGLEYQTSVLSVAEGFREAWILVIGGSVGGVEECEHLVDKDGHYIQFEIGLCSGSGSVNVVGYVPLGAYLPFREVLGDCLS